MKDRKMSDIFELPMKVDGYSVESQPSIPDGYIAELVSDIECDSAMDATYVAHAINNHDRMVEEIAELKGALNNQLSVLKGYKGLMIYPLSIDDDIANIDLLLAKLNQEGEE